MFVATKSLSILLAADAANELKADGDENARLVVLLLFLTFFAIFCALGFLNARKRRDTPDYLLLRVARGMRYLPTEKRLVYGQEGQTPLYAYDVEHNVGTVNPSARLTALERRQQRAEPINSMILTSVLGGMTSAWTIKDVIDAIVNGKNPYYVIGAVFGAASGYSVGFYLGRLGEPAHDDPKILGLLSDEKRQKEIKSLAYASLLKKREQIVSKPVTAAFDPSSMDFSMFDNLSRKES